jgi:hypothetical protein
VVKSKYKYEDIVEDGESVRVPLYLCDSVQRQFVDADQMRQDARQEMIDRATTAWRENKAPTFVGASDRRQLSFDAAQTMRNAAYHRMVAKISDAWRTPPHRDAAQPDTGTPPDDLMQRHLRTEPDADA